MKLPVPEISSQTSQMLFEQSFGIGDLGVVFDILRNKLYKNPILAICREYTCNARDAHREIGIPERPIEIHLPNAFSPEYRVKDFGPGISPERMSNVFIKYASSTKRNDNIQTGSFGIGAKSAWSLSDTFSIITVVDGVRRIYNAYIDESQVGKMALAFEEKTDEPNGTTIIIPVQKYDYEEFIKCTLEVTQFWNPRPKLLGISPAPSYEEREIILQGKNWGLLRVIDSYNRKPKAIIDGIIYDIDINQIKNVPDNISHIFHNCFILYFEIGELSLSASRDSIHYDDRTQKLLLKRLGDIGADLSSILSEKVKNLSSYKEACLFVNQLLYEYNLSKLAEQLNSITWNNFKVRPVISNHVIGKWSKISAYSSGNHSGPRSFNSLSLNTKGLILLNDKTQERIDRNLISYIFEKTSTTEIQVISIPEKPSNKNYKLQVANGVASAPVYDTNLINLIIDGKLSDYKIPKNRKKYNFPRKKSNSIPGYRFSYGTNYPTVRSHNIEDSGGPFVVVDYRERIIESDNIFINDYDYIKTVENFLGTGVSVVGFSKAKSLSLKPHWIPLKTVLENKLTQLEKQLNFKDLLEDGKSLGCVFDKNFNFCKFENQKFKNLLKTLSNNSVFLEYIKESEKVSSNIKKYDYLFKVLHLVRGTDLPDKYHQSTRFPNNKLYILLDKVKKIYPMMIYLHRYYDATDQDLINYFDYIKLIDQKRPKNFKLKKSS